MSFFKHHAKLITISTLVLSALIFIPLLCHFFGHNLFAKVETWAYTATYLGLGLSLISVAFIYLTYNSQTTMASVLQFESVFFQWMQSHNDLRNSLRSEIHTIAEQCKTNLKDFTGTELTFQHFENTINEYDPTLRRIMPFYRSLYSMLKYINNSTLIPEYRQKKKYYDILQSQMGDDEYMVIFNIAMADPNLQSDKSREVLSQVTLLDLLDKTHILKNLYYTPEDANYDILRTFIHDNLPRTFNSAHFFH